MAAHAAVATDAHDASAVSILDSAGFFTGTDVEAALAELGRYAVTPAAAVAVNSVTDVTLGTKSVTLAAGDQAKVDAWVLLLNNSGATRVYVLTLDVGALFDVEFTTPALAASATAKWMIHLQGVTAVVSTSLALTMTEVLLSVAGPRHGRGLDGRGDAPRGARLGDDGVEPHGQPGRRAEGPLANATATQTADLVSMTVERVRPA